MSLRAKPNADKKLKDRDSENSVPFLNQSTIMPFRFYKGL
jgi:hypothetical protein